MRLVVAVVITLLMAIVNAQQSTIPIPCGGALPHAVNFTALNDCIRHLPFSEAMRTSTIATLQSFISGSYVFREMSMDFVDPAGHFGSLSVDLIGQLEQMKTRQYAYDFDFHMDVTKLFNSLNDAHTRYHAPAPYAGVGFLQPLRFEHLVTPATQERKVFIRYADPSVYQTYKNVYGVDPRPAVSVDGWQLMALDGREPTAAFMARANEIGLSRDAGTRFNLAVHGMGGDPINDWSFWAQRSVIFGSLPLRENATYSLMNPADNTQRYTWTMNWIGINSYNLTSFNGAAPVMLHDVLSSKAQATNYQHPHMPPILAAYQRMAVGTEMAVETSNLQTGHIQAAKPKPKRTAAAAAAAGRNRQNAGAPTNTVTFQSLGGGVSVLKIGDFAPASTQDFINNVQAAVSTWGPDEKIIIDLTGNGGGDICLGYAVVRFLYPQLFAANTQMVGTYDWPATFLWQQFANLTAQVLQTMPQLNDMAGFLAPWYWRDPTKSYSEFLTADWLTAPIIRQRPPVRGDASLVPPSLYSQLVSDTCDNYWNDWVSPDLFPTRDPNNVVLLSNGLCGSTCSVFSSFIQMHKLAKTVAFGGTTTSGAVDPSLSTQQFWSFPGGMVGQLDMVLQIAQILNMNMSLPPVPPPFQDPTNAQLISGTVREIYPWANPELAGPEGATITANPDKYDPRFDVPLEFVYVPATFQLPYTATERPSNTSSLYEKIRRDVFPRCVTGITDQTCTVPNGSGVPQCNSAGQLTGQCFATRCDGGYFRDDSNGGTACVACGKGNYRVASNPVVNTCSACTNADTRSNIAQWSGGNVYTDEVSGSAECPFEANSARLAANLAATGVVTALIGGLFASVLVYRRSRSASNYPALGSSEGLPVKGDPRTPHM